MLLVLMYHRVCKGKRKDRYTNELEHLRKHLLFLKENYPLVLPGQSLAKKQLSICLTFDDATCDFYYYVFPLLQAWSIPVILGVPVHYIVDTTSLIPEERINLPHSLLMQEGIYEKKVPFCTWEELKEMQSSSLVHMASHSYSHSNLTFPFVNLEEEITLSKQILENKMGVPPHSFIYPFGKVSPLLHKRVTLDYKYAFRIGSAMNFGWQNEKKPLCRVSADHLVDERGPLSWQTRCKAYMKALISR